MAARRLPHKAGLETGFDPGDALPDLSEHGRLRPKKSRHRSYAWAVLALSLGLTFLAWKISNDAVKNGLNNLADFEAADIGVAISKRIGDQQRVLRAGAGLFNASQEVSREEFRDFVQTLRISQNYPGLQGYGYAQVISPSERAAHIARIRAEGFTDYTIKPAGKRSLYTSIVYLEPFDWRNKRAFGYDMFSQDTRRAAMERARDTGLPSMTGAVTLVQETAKDTQRGFLIYVPVYDTPEVPLTLSGRRKALRGFVYSPFRMNDLMQGVLGKTVENARLRIFDGGTLDRKQLLYDSQPKADAPTAKKANPWVRVNALAFGGRTWTLQITPDMKAFGEIARLQPLIVAAGGIAINLLIFYLILSFARRTERANALADKMTSGLRRQMRRSRLILDTIADGIATADSNGRILTMNPAGCRLFGYSAEKIKTLTITDLVPEAGETLRQRAPFPSRPGSTIRATGITQDGEEVPVAFSATPLPDSQGNIWTWMLRDISEQTRVEKIQREFIAVVSHELRTPLTALAGSLGVLNHGSTREKTAALIKLAHNNAQRLSLLVNDILDMEKFRSSDVECRMRRIDLVPLMHEVLAEHKSLAAQSEISLELKCKMRVAPVTADGHRLRQVLSNLVSNALKFSKSGGRIELGLYENAGSVRIAVSDEGRGIGKAHRRKIFESFYQIESLSKPKQSGTGLGLPIAQSIVEAHGSRIYVKSVPGQGSTFFFALPLLREELRKPPVEKNRNKVLDTDAVAV